MTATGWPRWWRYYRTSAGSSPVGEFLESLPVADRRVVRLAMSLVRREGVAAARHLRGDLYEVRVTTRGVAYRVMFVLEGSRSQVLLAVEAFRKQTQATPGHVLQVAEARVSDWRARGERLRHGRSPAKGKVKE
ncbi:MAG TPA: type II toxin-antitoxin system RelE/ParE family toxin [Acidimicrobiales bacterium]|nr:type II toxin-antitoxin system RelE/ParE family toxin [Acidimicrobiales bacterium]